jgi:hypothetical protein
MTHDRALSYREIIDCSPSAWSIEPRRSHSRKQQMALPGWEPRRLLLGTASALLAHLLVALPSARAECGDYVVLGSAAQSKPQASAMRISHDAANPLQHPAKKPGPGACPLCKRAPVSPPAIPVTHSYQEDHWGTLSLDAGQPNGPAQKLALDHPTVQPISLPLNIFHPPRRQL